MDSESQLPIYTEEVTKRPVSDYLHSFAMKWDSFRGKVVGDFGAGLSDLTETINSQSSQMFARCYSVDPIYTIFRDLNMNQDDDGLFEELNNKIKDQRVFGQMEKALAAYSLDWVNKDVDELDRKKIVIDAVRKISSKISGGQYVGESAESMHFSENTFDLILMQNFINRNLTLEIDTRLTKKIILESARVLKSDGEIRIVPAGNFVWDSTIHLDVYINGYKETDWNGIRGFQELENKGLKFYLVKAADEHLILIIRKDETKPFNFSDFKETQVSRLNFRKDESELEFDLK